MSLLMQQILAALLTASAVGYIAIHYYRKKKNKTGCAACKALEGLRKKSKSPGELKAEQAVR